MPQLPPSALLNAVNEVAELAGAAALAHFRTGVAVETKGDGSPVTIADRAAEQVAREWIARHFPEDAILGEEFGTTGAGDGRRCWIIDPIDGTKSFVRGVPLWGAMVAVTLGQDVLAGAINCPAVGEQIVAVPGEGCWFNGARCHVSTVASLADATILTTDDRFPDRPHRRRRWEALAARSGVARTWGDCYGYLLVVTGRAEAMVDDIMNPWDSAPLLCLLEEAGGVLTDWSGWRTGFGGNAIATNRALATTIRTALADQPGDPS
jgi:histidinol phosphatase-like enzyme (inositol monophosphatase family)